MGHLFIGGTPFDIEAPIVSWHQSGWNATTQMCVPVPGHKEGYGCVTAYGERAKNRGKKRYSTRPRLRQFGETPKYDAVKSVIRKFVLHHDGCLDAKMCWNVLHNERGLSCHFIIDNDGTIYQTLDLGLMGYHAAEFNADSIGVEFCNRGDSLEWPNYYKGRNLPHRDETTCKINGHTIRSYDFTKPQYIAFNALAKGLTKLLPNLPVEYPQEPGAPGKQSWGTIDHRSAMGYAGYIGHYHLTNQKWDPGPFDIMKFCKELRGTYCFPVFTREDPKRVASDRPEIPKAIDELRDVAKELYATNEDRADGGFFPVGPWGESRLWHGGIHVTGKEGQPIYAPFPGRIVVARMGSESAVGSHNFVLIRHDLTMGDRPMRFWSLYMHLADALAAAPIDQPEWMTKDKGKNMPTAGQVMMLDEPVLAGSLIGHMGSAGPDSLRKPQLHLEFFSIESLFEQVTGSPWEFVDGTSGGRFCDAEQIVKLIDTDHDGKLSTPELSTFYKSGGAQQFRTMMTYHVSEWTFEPDWHDALRSTPDYRAIKPAELDAMIDEQIVPGLWWNDDVAAWAGLPSGGEVVHYHPVKFLHWVNEKLLEVESIAVEAVDEKAAVKTATVGLTDDFGDVEGAHAMSATDQDDDRCDKAIELEDMLQGFDAPAPPGCEP